jgi:hypothetical protein
MDPFVEEMRKVSRLIDDYTERWAAEPESDDHKWKEMVDLFLAMSRLPPSSYDIILKDAEGKKRWELHLRGKLSEDEFEVRA